jgi:hypothetical protein
VGAARPAIQLSLGHLLDITDSRVLLLGGKRVQFQGLEADAHV